MKKFLSFLILTAALLSIGFAQTRTTDTTKAKMGVYGKVVYPDSTVGADTSICNFKAQYLKCYITIHNQNVSTADTMVIESYNPVKGAWVATEMGVKNTLTGAFEADNTLIVLAASTAKTYEINVYRPDYVRVRPKVVTGRAATRKCRIAFTGVN